MGRIPTGQSIAHYLEHFIHLVCNVAPSGLGRNRVSSGWPLAPPSTTLWDRCAAVCATRRVLFSARAGTDCGRCADVAALTACLSSDVTCTQMEVNWAVVQIVVVISPWVTGDRTGRHDPHGDRSGVGGVADPFSRDVCGTACPNWNSEGSSTVGFSGNRTGFAQFWLSWRGLRGRARRRLFAAVFRGG